MTYEATTEDLNWAKGVIAILKDGGVITMPGCGNTYQLDKEKQVMTLLSMMDPTDPDAIMTHRRTQIVFKEIGWKVEG